MPCFHHFQNAIVQAVISLRVGCGAVWCGKSSIHAVWTGWSTPRQVLWGFLFAVVDRSESSNKV